MAKTQTIAAYINNEFTGHTASATVIAQIAALIVDEAGVAGGSQEVEAIARDGWGSHLELDARLHEEDRAALLGAIQFLAKLECE